MTYMHAIDARLRELFREVESDPSRVDGAVSFIKDEILASYRRGQEAARSRRKRAFQPVRPSLPVQ